MQGLNGSAVLTFIGYKRTDKQAKYIDSIFFILKNAFSLKLQY